MDLTISPEQIEIIDSASAFLRSRLPITRTRELLDAESNADAAAWIAAAELGWLALGLPESLGGVGCGLADEALLFREIGRSLATGPFLSSVLAARVAGFGGDLELAANIVGGSRRVGMAIALSPELIGSDGLITGDLQLLDTDTAIDSALVLVVTASCAALVQVSSLVEIVVVPCIDPGIRIRRARADGVRPVVIVGADLDPIERRGQVLAAAMLTGITEAVRDIAAAHAINRVQFGKPIGVNQAIKHPCAEIAVAAQLAYAQLVLAAVTTDERRADADLQALSANLVAAEAAEHAAAATIQILGGMGFTFEHDANLYAKRAFVLAQLFGATSEKLTRLLELPAAR
jgi:alkylation response protein AidB-like acyl-CoA dehydrogenase